MFDFVKRTILAASVAGLAAPAFAADPYYPPVEESTPPAVYQEEVSYGGWYLRGDVDYHWSKFRGADFIRYGAPGEEGEFDSGKLKGALSLGAGVGYLISVFAAGKRDEQVRDELLATADRMAAESAAAGPVAAPTPTPLTDTIRAQLGRDERTSALTGLDINVAEGTVFVRGTVPAGFDQATIRDVIAEVPGVHDVDLQVTPSNSNV